MSLSFRAIFLSPLSEDFAELWLAVGDVSGFLAELLLAVAVLALALSSSSEGNLGKEEFVLIKALKFIKALNALNLFYLALAAFFFFLSKYRILLISFLFSWTLFWISFVIKALFCCKAFTFLIPVSTRSETRNEFYTTDTLKGKKNI